MKTIPYAIQWIDKKDIRSVTKILKSNFLTQGPTVELFDRAVAKCCDAKYAVSVANGTAALHLACLAAGIQSGDEVITSPISFVASANCVLYSGGKPIFADIREDTINIDPAEIEKKITGKTKAIIPVDFAGQPADLKKIYEIAQKNKLLLIEDASHALGATYEGTKIGSGRFADMTTLSFHAVKHITTAEGGAVVMNNDHFYKKLLRLRTHGITRDPNQLTGNDGGWYYEMQDLGFNYRLTDMQCALGLSQLPKLNKFLKRRREIAAAYNKAFSRYDEVRFLPDAPQVRSAQHIYVLMFKRNKFSVPRKTIFEEYRRQGILVNVHYIPIYYQPFYQKIGYARGSCPNAENYYEETVTLPLFPKMSTADVKRVIAVTEKIIQQYRKVRS